MIFMNLKMKDFKATLFANMVRKRRCCFLYYKYYMNSFNTKDSKLSISNIIRTIYDIAWPEVLRLSI